MDSFVISLHPPTHVHSDDRRQIIKPTIVSFSSRTTNDEPAYKSTGKFLGRMKRAHDRAKPRRVGDDHDELVQLLLQEGGAGPAREAGVPGWPRRAAGPPDAGRGRDGAAPAVLRRAARRVPGACARLRARSPRRTPSCSSGTSTTSCRAAPCGGCRSTPPHRPQPHPPAAAAGAAAVAKPP